MGYFVETAEIDFAIPAENLDAAYEAMCKLNAHDELKHGGVWGGKDEDYAKPAGSTSLASSARKNFSWMDWNYDETCATAQEIFEQLGFDTDVDEEGNLRVLFYDNKTGQEELFLEACAPYVDQGSYIIWHGEDNAMWQNEFDGETMNTKHAKIVWE